MDKTILGKPVLHIFLISLLGILAYSNTFNVPFQWDDKVHIASNPVIKDFKFFRSPSNSRGVENADDYKRRYVSYLTFALNHRWHGLDVTGYHIVNLAIHAANACLVYFAVMLFFQTPFLGGSVLKNVSGYIALFSSAMFVSHPVQTQAVTYIYQRHASLAAFFYLLSFVFYIRFRISSGGRLRYSPYVLSLLSALLAMKTKENAFTLPLTVALYEGMFFDGPLRKRVLYLFPFLLALSLIPVSVIGMDRPFWKELGDATSTQMEIPRHDYLLTQFPVVVTYLRLIFFPAGQNLDYDFPLFRSFLSPQVFLSFLFLLFLFLISIYLYIRSVKKDPALRFISFGIMWFFVALSVESSIIALDDLIFEHRLYLPLAGACMSIITGAFILSSGLMSKSRNASAVVYFCLTAIALIFAVATFTRNGIWKDEIRLWEDVIGKSPQKSRGYNNLGSAYYSLGQTAKATEYFRIAIDKDMRNAEAHYNLGVACLSTGLTDEAIGHLKIVATFKPSALAHNTLGIAYASKGLSERAIYQFQSAVKVKPDFAEAHFNLGNVLKDSGRIEAAIVHYGIALKIRPDFPEAHNNLGLVYAVRGVYGNALEHFQIALRLKPDSVDARFNLGRLYFEMGRAELAIPELETALRIKPDYRQAQELLDKITPP